MNVILITTNLKFFQVDQPSYGIDQEYFTKGEDKTIKAYLAYMINVAIMFGADPINAAIDMTNVLQFETKLANVMTE